MPYAFKQLKSALIVNWALTAWYEIKSKKLI